MLTFQVNGMPYGPREVQAIGGSPAIWTNNEAVPITVLVTGGTVTVLEFSRDGSTWDSLGILVGSFRLNPRDSLRITYLTVPQLVAYPL